MAIILQLLSLFPSLILYVALQTDVVSAQVGASEPLSRANFPDGFLFGAASSAYQYEGAWKEGGKGLSIWDNFTLEFPEKIADHSNGDVAQDFYHRYKEDIKMMKEMGIDTFRLSISWPRILPRIKPFATIFHWDTPQALAEEYGGFLSINIVDDFREYADLCFKLFGDRVKYWITVNEPELFSALGYAAGIYAPGRCSDYVGNCTAGNSATEPYLVTHHLLLSHASAFRLYQQKYKKYQQGEVGLTVHCDWMVPFDKTQANVMAASRAFQFNTGWILNPVIMGDYPKIMRRLVGKRLPYFTKQQAEMVKGSFDFLGMNYYSGLYAEDDPSSSTSANLSYTTDSQTTTTNNKDGVLIGEPTGSSRICVYPEGLRQLLDYMMATYNNPPMIITENGMPYWNDVKQPIEDALRDYERIRYHHLHLLYLQRAIKKGANVSGYLAWSFMDDFEWESGFTLNYGFIFVDRRNKLTRFPRLSATWYRDFLHYQNGSTEFIRASKSEDYEERVDPL